jgi:hypothetical protein
VARALLDKVVEPEDRFRLLGIQATRLTSEEPAQLRLERL